MDAIKRLRQQKNMTQAELAQKLGVTQSVVAMWERDASLPNAAKLPALADALGCTIDALYGRDGAEREHGVPRKPSEAVCVGEEERRNE